MVIQFFKPYDNNVWLIYFVLCSCTQLTNWPSRPISPYFGQTSCVEQVNIVHGHWFKSWYNQMPSFLDGQTSVLERISYEWETYRAVTLKWLFFQSKSMKNPPIQSQCLNMVQPGTISFPLIRNLLYKILFLNIYLYCPNRVIQFRVWHAKCSKWYFNGYSMSIQWKFIANVNGNLMSMSIQWKFNVNSMSIQCQFNENSMSIQWKFNVKFNENSMSIQLLFTSISKCRIVFRL
jgi:hypothetical protein